MIITRRSAIAGFAAVGATCALAQTPPMPVVATFSILGDLARQVGGKRVVVTTLVSPGSDVHVYEPSPEDARKVAVAQVLVVNGLGLEGWMDRLSKAAASRARVVVASAGVKPREMPAEGGGRETDPHAWQSVASAKTYVANIRDAFIASDPDGAEAYRANADAYLKLLDGLDGEVRAAIASIPLARRRIITTHDAFGYFGAAYGFAFVAPTGVSTESEASARDIAKIIRQIKAEKFPAVFLENISDPRLARRLAEESGAKVGGTLYSDSLSPPDGAAGTYIDMMRNNIRELTAALAN
jgi:zinc/manganese transport system substrate-binding protein